MSLVSVIIPAYRAHDTIARAVVSLVAQSFEDWEGLVVADDGTDYRATLQAAGLDDPRLRYVTTGRTGTGAPAARNVGLTAALGELIAPLDADDVYDRDRLAVLAPLADRHGAAGDNVRVVDDHSNDTLSTLFPTAGGDLALDAAAFLATSVPMIFVIRRELAGRWDEDVVLCDDVAFNFRLFDRIGSIPVTSRPLHEYRVRAGSICHADHSAEWAERGYTTILTRIWADGFGVSESGRSLLTAAIERKRALNRDFAAAQHRGEVANFQEFIARHSASR